MIRQLAISIVCACLNGCALHCTQNAPAVSSSVSALPAHQVNDHVWFFQGVPAVASTENEGFTSNAGFIVTRDQVVVFDALGTPVLGKQMIAAIREVTALPIRTVIISHYHADHFYGLQAFKALGAEVWARTEGHYYLNSDLGHERLAQRRETLAPWVDEHTQLIEADRWIDLADGQALRFTAGDMHFQMISGGASHAPDDAMLFVEEGRVLFAGDVFFTGRLPFVVDGNTREWLAALDRIEALDASVVIPGHGGASHDVETDLQLTRRYLSFLRKHMGAAVENLVTFDEAYATTDWSEFAALPTFDEANRRNAYSVYLEMQHELLEQ